MNLPNKLTISRIILTFVFMVFLFSKGIIFSYLAFFSFIAACVTDFYDGRIARRTHSETDFGRLMDPIADKILILAAFMGFVELRLVPAWMVVLIMTRELMITGLRIFASSKGVIISASEGGKHKTISQMLAIFTILGFIVAKQTLIEYYSFWNARLELYFNMTIFFLMMITVILTLISGFAYLYKNRKLLIK